MPRPGHWAVCCLDSQCTPFHFNPRLIFFCVSISRHYPRKRKYQFGRVMLLPNQILSYDFFGKLKQQEASFTFWSKGLELNHTKGVTPILLYAIGNYRHIYYPGDNYHWAIFRRLSSSFQLLTSSVAVVIVYLEWSHGCSRRYRPLTGYSPKNLHQLLLRAHLQHDWNPVSCWSVWTSRRRYEALDGKYCNGSVFCICCWVIFDAQIVSFIVWFDIV